MENKTYTLTEVRELVTKAWEEGKNAQRRAIQEGFWAETGYDAEALLSEQMAGNWVNSYDAEDVSKFLKENNL